MLVYLDPRSCPGDLWCLALWGALAALVGTVARANRLEFPRIEKNGEGPALRLGFLGPLLVGGFLGATRESNWEAAALGLCVGTLGTWVVTALCEGIAKRLGLKRPGAKENEE